MGLFSKAIHSIGYDSDTQKMKIRFKRNKTYDFSRVPEELFLKFLSAKSKGKFYHDHIEGKYRQADRRWDHCAYQEGIVLLRRRAAASGHLS